MIIYINHKPIIFSRRAKLFQFIRPFNRIFSLIFPLTMGPKVVIDNLIDELKTKPDLFFEISYRQIPKNKSIDIMWVITNRFDLKWAVKNKKKINAKEIWAGPNQTVMPQEFKSIIASPKIDKIIIPSDWVKKLYILHNSKLKRKIELWPISTDTVYWSPSNKKKKCRNNILLYNKNQDELCSKLLPLLNTYSSVEVIKYGDYTKEKYKKALDNSDFMVWVSKSESQGIALLEALSMDVPVLAWDSGLFEYYSKNLKQTFKSDKASSSPYFSDICGIKFKSENDFKNKLKVFISLKQASKFAPRKYVINLNKKIKETLTSLLKNVKA